jgi:hypothetical protein
MSVWCIQAQSDELEKELVSLPEFSFLIADVQYSMST